MGNIRMTGITGIKKILLSSWCSLSCASFMAALINHGFLIRYDLVHQCVDEQWRRHEGFFPSSIYRLLLLQNQREVFPPHPDSRPAPKAFHLLPKCRSHFSALLFQPITWKNILLLPFSRYWLKYFRIFNDIWIKITHIFTLLSTVFIIWYMSVLNTKPSYKTKACIFYHPFSADILKLSSLCS